MRLNIKLRQPVQDDIPIYKRRADISGILMLVAIVILLSRLYFLQVMSYEKYKIKSENNRIRTFRVQAARGNIYDRFGRMIAGTKPYYNVCILRQEVTNMEALLAKLAQLLGEDEMDLRLKLHDASRNLPLYEPIVIERAIDWDKLCLIEAQLHNLPGVVIDVAPGRAYPDDNIAPHLIGYLGEITDTQLTNPDYKKAVKGDVVGQAGVEAVLNDSLSGEAGKKMVEVNVVGGMERMLEYIPSKPGNDVYLTIDMELQKAAESALENQVGAIVAMEPETGRILAMASSPKFKPELFAKRISTKEWEKLNDPDYRPLFNKALQGAYPPGSTFKIVMALAALQEGINDANTSYFCNGSFPFGSRVFRCWNERGHGQTSLYRSLVESCDVYYYQTGLRLGIDRLSKYAKMWGLGEKTGIDLPHENTGLIPSREWKKARYKDKWHDGETVSVSIGQGYVTMTPLQGAFFLSAVANGGKLYKPNFVEKVASADRLWEKPFTPELLRRIDIPPSKLKLVQDAITGVVQDPRGTAHKIRIDGINIAGKTGTAQVVKQAARKQDEKMAWKYRDHAWFVCYAPAEDPKITVSVIIEHGGHGGSAAAPVAKKVIEKWLELQTPLPNIKYERLT